MWTRLVFPCVVFLLFGQALNLTAEDQQNVPPEGFTALFNGKDLTGWRGLVTIKDRLTKPPEEVAKMQEEADKSMREHWKVENGVLVFDGKGQSLCTAKD